MSFGRNIFNGIHLMVIRYAFDKFNLFYWWLRTLWMNLHKQFEDGCKIRTYCSWSFIFCYIKSRINNAIGELLKKIGEHYIYILIILNTNTRPFELLSKYYFDILQYTVLICLWGWTSFYSSRLSPYVGSANNL